MRVFEVLAALATAALHVVTDFVGGQGVYTVTAVCLWSGYILLRMRRDPGIGDAWGLTAARLGPALRATLPFGMPVLAAMLLAGLLLQRLPPPRHSLPIVLLYPLWGLIQQLLVQGFIVRHLDDWLRGRYRLFTTLLAALTFGIVHLPGLELFLATVALGLAFTPLWLRYRNLWPLGLWHGILGAAYYYLVLGRDPWLEHFG